MNTKNTFSKSEKLKSRKAITELFTDGKSVSKFPIRLVFAETEYPQEEKIKIGVSVSKKFFKKAVDRNYIKRVMREAYRLNKSVLKPLEGKHYSAMLIYQSKEILDFKELNAKMIQLFEKFNLYISESNA